MKNTIKNKEVLSETTDIHATNTGKIFNDEWRTSISKSLTGRDHKAKRRFSDEIETKICNMYSNDKKSFYVIAKDFKCDGNLIKDILIRNQIAIRPENTNKVSNGCNRFTATQEKEICDKYSSEVISISEMSRIFKCGKTTIRNILLRNNIKL